MVEGRERGPRREPRAGAPVRVLFVGGCGRSGSTLLDRSLGQLEGTCAVGELVHVWFRGLLEDHLCGCGVPFHACPFWSKVGDVAFGGWGNIDPAETLRLQRAVDRNRYIPFMLAPRLFPAYRRRLLRYVWHLNRLYRAIAEAADAPIVIDSSKHASFAFLLRHVPGIDLRVIHLVRDPRGVAYSWTKKVRRPEVRNRTELMPRSHPARIALRWNVYNAAFHLLRWLGAPTLFVRYESLVRDLPSHIRRIASFAGVPENSVPAALLRADAIELRPTHSVAGNPMRFQNGLLRLSPDETWRTAMDAWTQSLVYVLTLPLARRYGYGPRGVTIVPSRERNNRGTPVRP